MSSAWRTVIASSVVTGMFADPTAYRYTLSATAADSKAMTVQKRIPRVIACIVFPLVSLPLF